MRPIQSLAVVPWTKSALVLVIAAALSGCAEDDMADLKAYVSDVKARQKSSVEPIPEIKTAETFIFNPEGIRDPFVKDDHSEEEEEVKVDNGLRPDTNRAKEELESFTLDSLRMVGTVNMENQLWALVRAADGTVHRVRNGNYMGKNYGRITRIQADRIELTEIIPDGPTTWRERPATLALAEH